MHFIYHPKFKKEINELPQRIKILAAKKLKIFFKNPFDSRLKTHRLQGDLNWLWAFWINRNYRIGFEILDEKTIRFYTARIHDKMYKK